MYSRKKQLNSLVQSSPSMLLTVITAHLYKCDILPSTVEDWTCLLYILDTAPIDTASSSLPIIPLSAFIYKVEPSSNKQSSAEDARSPAVVVPGRLAVANRPASVEIDAHGIEKTEDG